MLYKVRRLSDPCALPTSPNIRDARWKRCSTSAPKQTTFESQIDIEKTLPNAAPAPMRVSLIFLILLSIFEKIFTIIGFGLGKRMIFITMLIA